MAWDILILTRQRLFYLTVLPADEKKEAGKVSHFPQQVAEPGAIAGSV